MSFRTPTMFDDKNVTIPFKWTITSETLETWDKTEGIQKYLGTFMDDDWFLRIMENGEERRLCFCLFKKRRKSKEPVSLSVTFYSENPKEFISENLEIGKKGENIVVNIPLNEPLTEMVIEKQKIKIVGHVGFHLSFPNEANEQQLLPQKGKVPPSTKPATLTELLGDIDTMCDNSMFSDVTLRCDSQVFSAHKIIIAARCPVLAKSFLNRSGDDVKINITDISAPVFKALLEYIYTSKIKIHDLDFTLDLLSAANKYKLQSLAYSCRHRIVQCLIKGALQNVFKVLEFSHRCDILLKGEILLFIVKFYGARIKYYLEWKIFQKESPYLASEILTVLQQY